MVWVLLYSLWVGSLQYLDSGLDSDWTVDSQLLLATWTLISTFLCDSQFF